MGSTIASCTATFLSYVRSRRAFSSWTPKPLVEAGSAAPAPPCLDGDAGLRIAHRRRPEPSPPGRADHHRQPPPAVRGRGQAVVGADRIPVASLRGPDAPDAPRGRTAQSFTHAH